MRALAAALIVWRPCFFAVIFADAVAGDFAVGRTLQGASFAGADCQHGAQIQLTQQTGPPPAAASAAAWPRRFYAAMGLTVAVMGIAMRISRA